MAMALSVSVCAYAGSGTSGGADMNSLPVIWFANNTKAVKICSVQSADFGAPVGHAVEESLQAWFYYVADKKVEKMIGRQIVARAEYLSTCNGTEDLKIYFGGTSPEVEKAKADFNDPLGFAHLNSFDDSQQWGKGFIWIRSGSTRTGDADWNLPFKLRALLTHEFVHIFGCGHIITTIMSPDIAGLLINSEFTAALAERDISIDQSQELLMCEDCTRKYTQASGCIDIHCQVTLADTFFKKLIGHAPIGKVLEVFTFQTGSGLYSSTPDTELYSGTLLLADDVSATIFTLSSQRMLTWANQNDERAFGIRAAEITALGTLSSADHTVNYTVLIERDIQMQALMLQNLDPKDNNPYLFSAHAFDSVDDSASR